LNENFNVWEPTIQKATSLGGRIGPEIHFRRLARRAGAFRGRARPPEGPGVPNFVTSGGDYLAADIGRCGCPNFRRALKFFLKTRDPSIFSQIPRKWPFVARAAAKGVGELTVLREKDRGTIGGRNPGCAPRNRPRPCIFLLTLVSCFPSFATGLCRKL